MAKNVSVNTEPVSHFRLLVWLKLRLIYLSYRNNTSKIVSLCIMIAVFVPLSFFFAVTLYSFASSNPELRYLVDRDVLAATFLIWLITPLVGFSMNESYDPTKLFVYPVRYQTIFAANVVGGLLEGSTLLVVPILLALLLSSAHSFFAVSLGIVILLTFMLLTIALAQALSLIFIGFLRSRKFRDIMIVFFPLLALLRYFIVRPNGQVANFSGLLDSPAWKVLDFLPPGWSAIALGSANAGNFGQTTVFLVLLLASAAGTVSLAAVALKQLFVGDRGTSVGQAKKLITEDQGQFPAERKYRDTKGIWRPISAMVAKEYRNFVREPQYKSMLVNMVYLFCVIGFSCGRFVTGPAAVGITASFGSSSTWIQIAIPVVVVGLMQFSGTSLTFNIFGGEGAAITVLFSFPTNRRYFVIGKNIAHSSVIILLSLIPIGVITYLTHSYSNLPLAVAWLVMASFITCATGNLASMINPHRLVVRGNRFNSGTAGSSVGCLSMLIWLLFVVGTVVAAIPAAACIFIPGIDPAYRIWYTLSIPLGLIYSGGVYYMSLLITDSWIGGREQDIISKLVLTE